jgi:hypothetical protein
MKGEGALTSKTASRSSPPSLITSPAAISKFSTNTGRRMAFRGLRSFSPPLLTLLGLVVDRPGSVAACARAANDDDAKRSRIRSSRSEDVMSCELRERYWNEVEWVAEREMNPLRVRSGEVLEIGWMDLESEGPWICSKRSLVESACDQTQQNRTSATVVPQTVAKQHEPSELARYNLPSLPPTLEIPPRACSLQTVPRSLGSDFGSFEVLLRTDDGQEPDTQTKGSVSEGLEGLRTEEVGRTL